MCASNKSALYDRSGEELDLLEQRPACLALNPTTTRLAQSALDLHPPLFESALQISITANLDSQVAMRHLLEPLKVSIALPIIPAN